jgi:short-subunit dehydrogenase
MDTEETKPLAIVTGASSGIGYELAKELALRDYDLLVVSSDQEELATAAEALCDCGTEPEVHEVAADLSSGGGVEAVYEKVMSLGRPVDVLAANAGVGVVGDFARETDLDAELALINLNVTSQVHLVKLIAHDMVERGQGEILITSSIASLMPGPFEAVYAASKAFLRSFGQAIRNELKDTGVNVTVLMPGPTDTEFFERAGALDTPVGEGPKQDPAQVAKSAIEALLSHDDHVVTGGKNKLMAGAAKLMSDEAQAKMHRTQTERK